MDSRSREHSLCPIPELGDNEKTNEGTENDQYLDALKALRIELSEKSTESELLKIQLNECDEDIKALKRELDEYKLSVFVNEEDLKKTCEEVLMSKKCEADYVKLMSEYLDLEEKTYQQKQQLVDNYHAKTNAINNFECLMSSGAIANELEECKLDLKNTAAELHLALAKLRNLEEDIATKEKTITELRKSFDDAKVTHKHEMTVLQEYIQCLKNTIISHEKTLANYTEG